jgi:Cu-processing system permease protein
MYNISKIVVQDLWKNKAIIAYGALMVLLGWGIFAIEDQSEKALLGLLRIILFIQPLVTVLFASMYYYNSQEFTLLLAAQPIERKTLFFGLYGGLIAMFTLIFFLSIGLPVLLYSPNGEGALLLFVCFLLILIFTSIALLISVFITDKARGIGFGLLVWTFFAFVYDGLLLILMYQMAAYPIEGYVLGLTFLNPVDISRITVISSTETAALLGLSGAVFQDFFGGIKGTLISGCVLIIWAIVPLGLAYRKFNRKDL